ncbi:hypothetical protein OROHE_012804 [Orobanche hederae]
MGKRKQVGIYGSAKKKTVASHKRSEGKRPVMRFDTTSESSDSGKKTIKEAHYPEVEYETENQTESENNSEDSGRNPLINDVLEAPTSDYSSDSGEEGKTKRLLPTNCFVALRRIPSWYMFEAIHKHGGERMMSRREKSEEVIRNILLSYDQESDHFILGGKELQLTGRDVALIFGIVRGTKKIQFKKPNARNAKWVKRNFGKDTKSSLDKTLIFNRMASILDRTDETSVEDALLFNDYLEDLEGAMTYDWCGYIAAILRNSIRNTRNLKIGGCAMLLPYWLCEHTSLVEPSRKVLFPRFMKWDLQKLLKRIFRVHLSYIDSSYVETSAAVCSTDQDISDGGENIHLTAELGADSNETHPKPGAMSFDVVHGDIASSSRTPFKAFGGSVVEGDIVQPSSLKNGRSVIREEAIREDEVLESAFGETLIPETAECEKADVAAGVKDKEPIISSCPSFSLDITQLRTPKKDQPLKDTEVIVIDSNLGKADPAIDEVDVIIDEWEPQNVELPNEADMNIKSGPLKLCIHRNDLESTIEKLKLEKEREKAAFEERLKAFEEQNKRICELNEARFRALEEHNRRLVTDNEIPRKTKVNSPNSMTKRIKARTVIGDRKPKDITPTRGERDLKRIAEIPYVSVEEFDDELNVGRVNENPFKGLDKRYHAVRKASDHLRSVVASHCSNGLESVVWRGLAPLAEVTADDIVSLLHHKPMKGKVIDAWAELMNHKYAAGPRSNKITIFTSSCWDLIAGNDSCPTSALRTLIDNRLEGSLQDDVLLFPLNTKGSGRMARDYGFHWTLLMLDVKNFSWRFFNTIRGRTDKMVDVHLRRSEKVMMYVEDKMKEFYKAMRADHPFLDNTFTKTEVAECIQ